MRFILMISLILVLMMNSFTKKEPENIAIINEMVELCTISMTNNNSVMCD